MSKLNLVPAPGYILVEPLEVEKKTPSGIVLPDSHEEKPLKGKVLAVGEPMMTESGVKLELWSKVEEGVIVIYKKWAGNEYRPEGSDKELLFVKFEDILAVEA